MSLKVYEIYDFANVFWNDFTPKSVALALAKPSFRLVNELGPLLVVALGVGSTLGAVLPALSSSSLSSSLLPSELSLSPSDACISTCKA
jgi:hypothetical protein